MQLALELLTARNKPWVYMIQLNNMNERTSMSFRLDRLARNTFTCHNLSEFVPNLRSGLIDMMSFCSHWTVSFRLKFSCGDYLISTSCQNKNKGIFTHENMRQSLCWIWGWSITFASNNTDPPTTSHLHSLITFDALRTVAYA